MPRAQTEAASLAQAAGHIMSNSVFDVNGNNNLTSTEQ